VFGCCGFLSFSSVFCKFGGRLETTLYIHFIRRWVKSRRHSSASREGEDEKKGGKVRHSSLSGFVGMGVGFVNRPVQLPPPPCLRLDQPPLAEGVCGLTAARHASSPLRLCAWRRLRPPLRLVYAGRETEQADVLCLHKCAATASASLSMKGVQPAGSVWGLMQVYTAGDGYSSSSGLTHLSPLLSNLKPSLLHVSRYHLNCLWSIGAVLFT
jgi:hypothetical protein